MPPSDPELLRWALKWLRKADKDLALDEAVAHEPYHYDSLAYHCQQAAEKYFKAALVAHGALPVFTHNLRVLLEELEKHQPVSDDHYLAAQQLNPFSVLNRYPQDDETEPPAALLLTLAQSLRDWLRPELAEMTAAGPYPTQ